MPKQPSRAEKTRGHAEHLLDHFIGLKEKYAMLRPITSDDGVISKFASAPASHALVGLRNTLSLSCIQDIAKLCLDSDKRVPSITNLIDALADPAVRPELEDLYSVEPPWPPAGDSPEVAAAILAMRKAKEKERREQFAAHSKELNKAWSELKDSAPLAACLTLRDKVVSHSELHHDGSSYRVFDIAKLGLKWSDIGDTILAMQALVDLITHLARAASFDFAGLDKQTEERAAALWPSAG